MEYIYYDLLVDIFQGISEYFLQSVVTVQIAIGGLK